MARPRRIDPALIQRAQDTAATTATSLAVLRRCQAVLLPALCGATLEQTAAALGVGRASMARLQTAFRNDQNPTPPPRRNWGGRRRSLLSATEEREFLQPWLVQAKRGGVVVVSPIRAALAQRLNQPVKASVGYRLLARQGWRKVAPDTRLPKSQPEVPAD